jgi:hypothetical protein
MMESADAATIADENLKMRVEVSFLLKIEVLVEYLVAHTSSSQIHFPGAEVKQFTFPQYYTVDKVKVSLRIFVQRSVA